MTKSNAFLIGNTQDHVSPTDPVAYWTGKSWTNDPTATEAKHYKTRGRCENACDKLNESDTDGCGVVVDLEEAIAYFNQQAATPELEPTVKADVIEDSRNLQACACGCQQPCPKKKQWVQGHDQRALAHLRYAAAQVGAETGEVDGKVKCPAGFAPDRTLFITQQDAVTNSPKRKFDTELRTLGVLGADVS